MTRKRYVKLKMAEGLSRNEANLNAREIVAEGLSYQGDYNADLEFDRALARMAETVDVDKLAEAMRPVIESMVETCTKLVAAFSAGMTAFSKAFTEAL